MDLDKLRAQAAEGSTVAHTILGSRLLDGVDVAQDYAAAREHLTQAAEAGAPRAMLQLARIYAEGLGVDIDAAKAQNLYERASEKGEFLAHVYLARTHLLRDPARARIYYQRAADLRDVLMDSPEMQEALEFIDAPLTEGNESPSD